MLTTRQTLLRAQRMVFHGDIRARASRHNVTLTRFTVGAYLIRVQVLES